MMNRLAKNLLLAVVSGSCFVAGAIKASDQAVIKTIELQTHVGADTVIKVAGTDGAKTFVLDKSELDDIASLENSLSELDDDTRERVIDTLKTIGKADARVWIDKLADSFDLDLQNTRNAKVLVMHKEAGNSDGFHTIHPDELKSVTGKHIVLKQVDHLGKDDAQVIAKLLEKGQFSQDDLDVIQAALDQKR